MSFKLAVVREVESGQIGVRAAMRKYGIQGHGTVTEWCRKYGSFNKDYQTGSAMPKSPQQKIMELEQKVRLLERQNAFLQEEMSSAVDKAHILDKLVDLAEEHYHIRIRKNSSPGQSEATPQSPRKR